MVKFIEDYKKRWRKYMLLLVFITTSKMSPKEFREKHIQRNLSKLTVSNNRGT